MYLPPIMILELVDLGDKVMKNKLRNHSAQFKVNVALAAAKDLKTVAELSKEYQIYPTQIVQREKQLKDWLLKYSLSDERKNSKGNSCSLTSCIRKLAS